MEDGDHQKQVALEQALMDPGGVFDAPADVLSNATLTDEQKVEILRIWAYDASENGVALEEGMRGEESDLLRRILLALDQLSADVDLTRTSSTKQHGIPRSAVMVSP
jgi:hypothetical protein